MNKRLIKDIELNKQGKELGIDLNIIEDLVYRPFKTKGDRYLIDIFKNSFCITPEGYGSPFECFTGLVEILNGIDLSAYYEKELSKKELSTLILGTFQMEYTLGVVMSIEYFTKQAISQDVFNVGYAPSTTEE